MIFKKFKRISHIALALFVCGIMIMPASATYNPLDNKGFETIITPDTGPNGNWVVSSNGFGDSQCPSGSTGDPDSPTTSIHRSGSYGIKIANCYVAQQVSLTPGAQFAGVELYARRLNSFPGNLQIDVEVITSSGLVTYISMVFWPSSTSWQIFRSYPPLYYGDVIVAIHITSTSQYVLIVDDVTILTGRFLTPGD